MSFLHVFLVPSSILILLIISQSWFNKEQFLELFKIYGIGILLGLIVSIISSIIDKTFYGISHPISQLLKCLLLNGLIFSIIFCISLYFIFQIIIKEKSASWFFSSFISITYTSGIYTTINIIQTLTKNYPNTPMDYLVFLPLIFIISIIAGKGIPTFIDSYEIIKKILWGIFSIGIIATINGIYNFLFFYDNIYKYLLLIPFIIVFIIFEIYEFKYYRK